MFSDDNKIHVLEKTTRDLQIILQELEYHGCCTGHIRSAYDLFQEELENKLNTYRQEKQPWEAEQIGKSDNEAQVKQPEENVTQLKEEDIHGEFSKTISLRIRNELNKNFLPKIEQEILQEHGHLVVNIKRDTREVLKGRHGDQIENGQSKSLISTVSRVVKKHLSNERLMDKLKENINRTCFTDNAGNYKMSPKDVDYWFRCGWTRFCQSQKRSNASNDGNPNFALNTMTKLNQSD